MPSHIEFALSAQPTSHRRSNSFEVARLARAKLQAEAAQPEFRLRRLVGHAMTLDNLILNPQDEEYEATFTPPSSKSHASSKSSSASRTHSASKPSKASPAASVGKSNHCCRCQADKSSRTVQADTRVWPPKCKDDLDDSDSTDSDNDSDDDSDDSDSSSTSHGFADKDIGYDLKRYTKSTHSAPAPLKGRSTSSRKHSRR